MLAYTSKKDGGRDFRGSFMDGNIGVSDCAWTFLQFIYPFFKNGSAH